MSLIEKLGFLEFEAASFAVEEENEKALIAALILSTRSGDLSLLIEENALKKLFRRVEIPLTLLEEKELISQILKGAKTLVHPFIVKKGDSFILKRYEDKKHKIFEALNTLEPPDELYSIDETSLKGLLPLQIEAIKKASKGPLTLILGGPGTGKTFTAGFLVKTLLKLSNNKLKVALAAPTGKAAINLEKSFGGDLKATTLHSLLNYKGKEPKPLESDILVIDESSMIDLSLMEALLSSLKPKSRLILLGDPHQLPPVEVGRIFPEMIAFCEESVIRLEECMRTDIKEILDLAHLVKEGLPIDLFFKEKRHSVFFEKELKFETCLNKCLGWLEIKGKEEAFLHLKKSTLLSPLRKGPFGFERLNEAIFLSLKRLKKSVPVPIMIVRNDKRLNLFNGQMGVLFEEGSALFEERLIEKSSLPPYEVAFCLSVHKSQGSEFEEVTLLLPDGSEVFGKELLYTGITRAKNRLNLIGETLDFKF
jgi:exodeoxyribonuclease V alpha subunit